MGLPAINTATELEVRVLRALVHGDRRWLGLEELALELEDRPLMIRSALGQLRHRELVTSTGMPARTVYAATTLGEMVVKRLDEEAGS